MARARWRLAEDVVHGVDGVLESFALTDGEGRSVPALHLSGIGQGAAEKFLRHAAIHPRGENFRCPRGMLMVEAAPEVPQVDDVMTVEERPEEATEFASAQGFRRFADDKSPFLASGEVRVPN